MSDIAIYSMADFLRFRQIILAYAATGSKLGLKTLKETEEFLQKIFIIPKGVTSESKKEIIPSDARTLMVYLESVCGLIKEMKDIFNIKGLSPREISKNDTRKKRRHKKKPRK